MPKVSVIVPVYNGEKYLTQCLTSLIEQSLSDIEIICINDGSIDNSLQILEEFSACDNRIIVISQDNQGVSSARNQGITVAKGEFITFVDCDDYLVKNALEFAYNNIFPDIDILAFGSYTIKHHKLNVMWDNELLKFYEQGQLTKEISADLIRIFSNVWAKFYRRDFITRNKIVFPDGINIAEDAVFNISALLCEPCIDIISQCLYAYRTDNELSITHQDINLNSEIEAFKYLEKTHQFRCQTQEIKLLIIEKFINGMLFRINRFKHKSTSIKEFEDFISYLEKNYNKTNIRLLLNGKKWKFSFIDKVFCIYESPSRKYKIIQIFNIKIKLRQKKDICNATKNLCNCTNI